MGVDKVNIMKQKILFIVQHSMWKSTADKNKILIRSLIMWTL